MASQSAKKLAKSNTEVLNNTFWLFLIINAVSLLSLLILERPSNYKPYLLLSIPSCAIFFIINKNGRPTFALDSQTGNTKLAKSGDDISRSGLYEYMFDVIYITWFLDILMVVFGTNKMWWLYSVIPIYAIFKLSTFALPFFKRGSDTSSAEYTNDQTKSKRQEKLEARKNKTKVRYR